MIKGRGRRLRTALLLGLSAVAALGQKEIIEDQAIRIEFDAGDLSVRVVDKSTGVQWQLSTPHAVLMDKRSVPVKLAGEVARSASAVRYVTTAGLEFRLALADVPGAVDYSFRGTLQPFGAPEMDEVELFHESLALPPGADNYYALPHRMGIQLRPEGDKPYSRRMPAYHTGRGYSMAMMGAVHDGSALLIRWDSIDAEPLIGYSGAPAKTLTAGLAMRSTARSVRLHVLGRGGYVEIAKAYREIARRRGLFESIAEKQRRNPATEKMIGAADFKPFTLHRYAPGTRHNQTDKEIVRSNFTFDEVAQLAEHFQRDLGIDRAMIVVAGWITGGYDGTHPDVLPAAAESGGNEGLAETSQRVKALGYLFGLHDNYTDFYQRAPSWSEDYIAKGQDGSLVKGGVWAGGQAYLICQRKSLELARRPQNVPDVFRLFSPDVYFIDCLLAMVPRVCQDPRHPVTKTEDVQLKLDLCDYARSQPALFGSEEGNESGVAHADYFEGILSQKTASHAAGAETVIPLFELVFGDAIPMLTHQSDRLGPDNPEQFLDHVLYAEMPVYRFGEHRYWTDPAQDFHPPVRSEAKLVYARGERWGRYDQFIKNSYEVLSRLSRLTATLPMTDHRFLTPDRLVEQTRFGTDVEITVNYGQAAFAVGDAVLPQYGFLIRSPAFVSFRASRYGRVDYADPPLFAVRALDGRKLDSSQRIRVYHGFGDARLDLQGRIVEVSENEKELSSGR